MLKKYLNELRQYKTLLITLLLLGVIGFLGAYSFKKIRSCINDYKFEKALEQAGKIDPNSWDEKYKDTPIKDKYKIVIISNGGGEYSYAEYFKYAAEKMGWEVRIYGASEFNGHIIDAISFDPDFMLFLTLDRFIDDKIRGHRSKKYLIDLSTLSFLRENGVIEKNKTYSLNADSERIFIESHAILTSSKEVDFYRIIFEKMNKSFDGLRLIPLAPKNESEPANPERLIWFSRSLLDFNSAENFKKFFSLLSDNVSMKVYGTKNYSSYYLKQNVYDGYIPSALNIQETIRKNGIYLLTHSQRHIKAAMPTLRIFEAVSANVIVISDKHPFAIEHFGDNFLYFDHNASAEEMYKQVKAHYDWIKANPKEAKAMANRAHQIFLEKFTLEKDLIRIAKMHEYIVKQEKEMGLSYPLVYY